MDMGDACDLGWNILYILKLHLQGLFREELGGINLEPVVEFLSECCYNKTVYNFLS